jgi:hypothetical protein
LVADDYRMTCVVAASNARDVFERPSKEVDYLALPFISPLRTYDDNRLHAATISFATPFPSTFQSRRKLQVGFSRKPAE